MHNLEAKSVAGKGEVPLGEPIPVKKRKGGIFGSQSPTEQYLIALYINMHYHIIYG